MVAFNAIYFIRNNAGTYEAYDTAGSIIYSGAGLVTDVLNQIEAAHAGRLSVFFGEGTFDMGTENWTLNGKNDVMITGVGIGITIIQNSSSAAADTEPFSITNCDRITFRDFTISAGGTARSTSDCIDLDDADDCLIERVEVLASRGAGIIIDGKDSGAQAYGNVVRDCIITGTQGTSAGHGIELIACEDTLLAGNYIFDTGGDGIKIGKASSGAGRPNAKCIDTIVTDNRINQAGANGIRILSCDRTNISGSNIITNSSDDTASKDGIRIETTNSITADKNIIVGAICIDDQGTKTQRYGINIGPASASEANDNLVVGNQLRDNLTGGFNDGGTSTVAGNNAT